MASAAPFAAPFEAAIAATFAARSAWNSARAGTILGVMKIAAWIVLGLLALVALVVTGALIFLNPIVKSGVQKGATYATGTETKLAAVDAGLFAGRFALTDLTIQNPPGFRDEPFVHIGNAQAKWENGTVLSDAIVIDTFAVDGVDLNLERAASGKTNYGAILDHLKALPGGEKAPKEPSSGKAKTLSIQRIEIKNVKAGLHLEGVPVVSGSMNVTVPVVKINGFTTGGSTEEIVAKLTSTLVHAVLNSALEAGKNVFPADAVKDLETSLKNAAKDVESQAKEALKGLNGDPKSTNDAVKGIEDILKGKKK